MRRQPWSSQLSLALLGLAALAAPSPAQVPGWKVVSWNDLGMHCMDSDYSVFSILPPFNVVWAQVIDPSGHLVTSDAGLSLTYEAVADPTGSINTTSAGKTNYWAYAQLIYGASSVPDTGLFGFDMPGPGNQPQPMAFDAAHDSWVATGIPITPKDDAGRVRTYPMMKIVARTAQGQVLAAATPVLPVSSEMDCRACHASGADPDAMPAGGWVYASQAERDYRLNILRLHDERQLGTPPYDDALASLDLNPAGLYAAVGHDHRPVLCAACHSSNALPGTGLAGISSLTSAVHAFHGHVTDPTNGMTLDSSDNRSACYRCHPGSETRCLRGAMGAAVDSAGQLEMQCQDCHAGMSAVGDPARVGWLEQPDCQACHTGTALVNNGQIRYANAFEPNGSLRVAVDQTFATNADVPAAPFSLYRFSEGHGGLMCEACHNSTHAEFPAAHPNDNILPTSFQGHTGTLVECNKCHGNQPSTINGGPHGMHPVGQSWVINHEQIGSDNVGQCRACHGTDYRGTVLSRAQADRTFSTDDFGTKTFFDGEQVSCYACHNGPSSSNPTTNTRPVAQSGAITVGDDPVAAALPATDANGNPLTWRIIAQPDSGRVGLLGNVATFHPDPGFAGTDAFTWSAWDGKADSNLATVTVTRLANWNNAGYGYPGTGGVVPQFTSSAGPSLGVPITLSLGNPSGVVAPAFIFLSAEYATLDTAYGGTLFLPPDFLEVLGVGPTGLSIPWAAPNDTGLIGLTIHCQAAIPDAGATFGFAFTRALRLVLGP